MRAGRLGKQVGSNKLMKILIICLSIFIKNENATTPLNTAKDSIETNN